jgi:hypothetical protein
MPSPTLFNRIIQDLTLRNLIVMCIMEKIYLRYDRYSYIIFIILLFEATVVEMLSM